ncbi:hypothetical protein EI555_001070, partial [Monodon monoceros]
MGLLCVGHQGTMRDYPSFSASVDAEAIRKAIGGIGTDEKTLISILTERSNAQRQLIAKEYQAAYGRELKDDLKGDLSGHFKCLMVALVTPPAVFDAKQLKKSMKGTGTNEDALIEILTTRTSRQMKEIGQAYYTVYKKSLGDEISSETSGDFRKALLTLADGRRDEGLKVDEQLAKEDAQILYNAGENKWGTDEDTFTEILCFRSFPQLKLSMDSHYNPFLHCIVLANISSVVNWDTLDIFVVLGFFLAFDEYRNISQKDIEDSIKGELSGRFEDLLLAIVCCARNTPAFLAKRLHQALKDDRPPASMCCFVTNEIGIVDTCISQQGAGTDEFTLNRIMVSRSEIDLLDIRAEFKKQYGYSLHSAIE